MRTAKTAIAALTALGIAALPLTMTGCDKTEARSKEVNKKTTETPSGTVKTTETTEKKVETNPK